MKKHTHKLAMSTCKRGFTMVEMVIVTGVLVAVMSATLSVYIMCNKGWHSTSVQMQATREASMGMARMAYGIGLHSGLREMTGLALLTDMNGVWTGTNYPPAASAPSHYLVQTATRPHPSWRIICTNYEGTVIWFDYNRAASNIVCWRQPGVMGSRELVANNVTDASALVTNKGVQLNMTVERRNGDHHSSVANTTFLRFRNR